MLSSVELIMYVEAIGDNKRRNYRLEVQRQAKRTEGRDAALSAPREGKPILLRYNTILLVVTLRWLLE